MSYITKIAANSARYKNFRQEFGVGILITAFVRFLTGTISIFAGYFYFANLLSGISTENKTIPIVLAVLVLAIVEFFSAWLLSKLTKSFLQGLYIRAAVLLVFSGFTFMVSFISSTNGLAMRQSGRVDNSTEIRTNYDLQKQQTEAKYQTVIDELKMQIQAEKDNPQGWRNGQRYYLTPIQLKRIDRINQNIAATRDSLASETNKTAALQKTDLQGNRATMSETASTYYNFIAIILLLSALSNITLQIFYVKIYREEKREFAQIDDVNIIKGEITANLWDGMRNEANAMRGVISQHLAIMNTVSDPKNEALQIMSNGDKKRSAIPGIRGFAQKTDKENETDDYDPENIDKRTYNLSAFEPYFTTSTNSGTFEKTASKNEARNEARNEVRSNAQSNAQKTNGNRFCMNCGKPFEYHSLNHKFCSTDCRQTYWKNNTGKKLTFLQ
jgi:hypothetical protein